MVYFLLWISQKRDFQEKVPLLCIILSQRILNVKEKKKKKKEYANSAENYRIEKSIEKICKILYILHKLEDNIYNKFVLKEKWQAGGKI